MLLMNRVILKMVSNISSTLIDINVVDKILETLFWYESRHLFIFCAKGHCGVENRKGPWPNHPHKVEGTLLSKKCSIKISLNGTNHEKESESDRFVKRHLEILKIRLH